MTRHLETWRNAYHAPVLATATAIALTAAMAGETVFADDEPAPITAEFITERHPFIDPVGVRITLAPEGLHEMTVDIEDGSNLAVLEITLQPGAMFPWHTHPGSVLAAVKQGDLIYIHAGDCVERPAPQGTAFTDMGFGHVHMAYNPSDSEETIVIATFIGAPDEGPLTVPVEEGEGAALDEKCGIER